LVFADR
jgi:hypothetical protein